MVGLAAGEVLEFDEIATFGEARLLAIRSLQAEASEATRDAFDIREDGSFTIRIATFELTAA